MKIYKLGKGKEISFHGLEVFTEKDILSYFEKVEVEEEENENNKGEIEKINTYGSKDIILLKINELIESHNRLHQHFKEHLLRENT